MRRIRETDLPLILAWSNSVQASGPYLTPECHTAGSLQEKFSGGALWNRNDKTFLVEKRRCGTPIGIIHYWLRQTRPGTALVSVKIAVPEERGSGFGTEAQKYLVMYLFDHVGVDAVDMYTDIGNKPQQRCLAKLGFTIVDSLTYDDRQVLRTGYMFQMNSKDYRMNAIYRYHYE